MQSSGNNPILTVVIPCWNVEQYIGELLNSIIAQSYSNWQVLAVDDCSTDCTANIIAAYHNKDSRIKYIQRDKLPKGAQTCRNIGLQMASGSKYIMFIDSDDILSPICFEQRISYMENHQDLDFTVFPAKVFKQRPWDDNTFILGIDNINDVLEGLLLKVLPFSVWNNIYKLDSIRKINLTWDERLLSLQDTDFNIQAILGKLKYAFAENCEVDYFWRINSNPNSTTSKVHTKEHFNSHLHFLEKLYLTIPNNLKKKYRIAIQYSLLSFLEMMKTDSNCTKRICASDWLSFYSLWYRIRINIYARVTNNNKLKHLLFPKIINYYLQYEGKHSKILSEKRCKPRS